MWPYPPCWSYLWIFNVREWLILARSSPLGWIWVWNLWQSAKNWWLSHLRAAMVIREYRRDELLTITLRSDLMNALLSCQVVLRFVAGEFKELAYGGVCFSVQYWIWPLGADANLVFLKWNAKVAFWHCLLLNVSLTFFKLKCENRVGAALGRMRVSRFWSEMRTSCFGTARGWTWASRLVTEMCRSWTRASCFATEMQVCTLVLCLVPTTVSSALVPSACWQLLTH